VKKQITDHWRWRIPEWFPGLGNDATSKLKIFHKELIEFNGRINLISPRTEQAADQIHFADGILGCRAIANDVRGKVVFDLGSGNGIPGLVMACLFPDIQVVPVEADARKVEFLKHSASRMGLKNIKVINARVEDLGEGVIGFGMSRGLASISKVLLLARKAAAPQCSFYHFKGDAWSSEVAEIPSQILAHWEIEHLCDYKLPDGGAKLTLIKTKRK